VKTPEQVSDEGYKVAPTNAVKEHLSCRQESADDMWKP